MTTDSIGPTSNFFSTGSINLNHLTPDAMMLYLESRLGSLDEQINDIIGKQKQSEAARKALQNTLTLLNGCSEEGGEIDAQELANCFDDIAQTFGVKGAHQIEEAMPDVIRNRLGDGDNNGNWGSGAKKDAADGNPPIKMSKEELRAAKSQLETMVKDIESGAELEMIKLQSLMSARNTAISLSTNMASSIGKGQEAIVGNIR